MSEFVDRLAPRGVTHALERPTLELDHVSVSFAAGANGKTTKRGNNLALEDVSFEIEKGERVAVVGPNGAGKTTLLRLIVGSLKPGSGQIHVYGHGPDDHICIAYVPQRNQIDWSFPASVEDVVMMGRVGKIGLFRWPKRRDREIVRSCLDQVRATHLAKRQIGELSGGQQQRVFIARALAQEAELLLMDEPLTGLDMPSQSVIFDILESIGKTGVTVLVATHDLNLAAERFDRVMLINRRLIAFGKPPTVLTSKNLRYAYGGQVHVVDEDESVFVTDTCCGHGEEEA
ncbi:MAG: metal ABC transporter ATP-binding protein [Candidatus Promineifilaceae bacterium]|nr:metal ABC transporter ATP-binding protein [Candidatus Promineifilaceae bacterium]